MILLLAKMYLFYRPPISSKLYTMFVEHYNISQFITALFQLAAWESSKIIAVISSISPFNQFVFIGRKSMLVGYVRVSAHDQNPELQRLALTEVGCEKIYEDQMNGTWSERPGLKRLLEMLQEGDTFVVWRLDRLGRTIRGLMDLVGELTNRGIQFKSLTDSIDTTTPAGRLFFNIMASLEQMERELSTERSRAGLTAARQQGRTGGRERKMTDSNLESAKKMLADGIPRNEVARSLNVSDRTLYRWIPVS